MVDESADSEFGIFLFSLFFKGLSIVVWWKDGVSFLILEMRGSREDGMNGKFVEERIIRRII